MSDAPEIPKLRLAPREPLEDMIHREERLRRAEQLQCESGLENSLAPFRVGSVPHLNAVPLTRGLETQIHFAAPAELAQMLEREELDAALISITEVLLSDRYDILDGIAIASLGEVLSVFLAHRPPLEQIREVYCDPGSLASVNLLKVLLAERGLRPEFKVLESYAAAAQKDAVMLIGDQALQFRWTCPLSPAPSPDGEEEARTASGHQIWDLGAAWSEMTRRPFVYAVWALRRGVANEPLRRQLREAKAFGMDTLDYIVSSRTDFDYNLRKDYLTWHIHYHLGADEKEGIQKFVALLQKHGLGPVYPPRYVG